jgi:phage gp29-like protein
VLGTRKRAVARLPIVVEAASDDPKDVKLADEVRALLKKRGTKGMIEDSLDALGKGYSVVEIMWDRSSSPWQPRSYVWRDPRFFQFDRDTLSELRLKDEADMMNGLPLAPYKFIIHTPRLKTGIQLRSGLARLAAWSFIFKNYTVKDWVAFCEVFGMPLRVGKYRPGETEDNITILKSAVANLGSDAAAVIPEGMLIEFIETAKGTGGETLFQRIADWFDKQVSKGVLGQTMTADDGSSQSQATVHNEVREDIRDADAEQLAETLERDLVIPYIDLNYGPQENYPTICLREPDQTDIQLMSESLAKLVPLGLKVEMSEVRDRLGFSDPAKDAECLGPEPKIPLNPSLKKGELPPPFTKGGEGGFALNSEQSATPDTLALLLTRMAQQVDPALTAWINKLRDLCEQADTMADLRDSILAAYPDLSTEALTQIMAEEAMRAQMAGRLEVAAGE